MSDALRTVLISLGTSLIVSLITFILGLKSGKNQADRQKMQELYKKLYIHFSEPGHQTYTPEYARFLGKDQ